MRLKPAEVRIVNAIRGLKVGQVLINKGANGAVQVETRFKGQVGAPVQQAQVGAHQGKVDRLRG